MIIWFHLKQNMNNFLWFYPHFCGYFLLFLIAPQLQNGQVCTYGRLLLRMLQMCCTSSTRGFFDYANATLRMTAHQRVQAVVLRTSLNGLQIKNYIIRRKNNNSYNKNQGRKVEGNWQVGVCPHCRPERNEVGSNGSIPIVRRHSILYCKCLLCIIAHSCLWGPSISLTLRSEWHGKSDRKAEGKLPCGDSTAERVSSNNMTALKIIQM